MIRSQVLYLFLNPHGQLIALFLFVTDKIRGKSVTNMVDLRIRFYLYLIRTMALIKDQFKSKHWCLLLSLLCVCTCYSIQVYVLRSTLKPWREFDLTTDLTWFGYNCMPHRRTEKKITLTFDFGVITACSEDLYPKATKVLLKKFTT